MIEERLRPTYQRLCVDWVARKTKLHPTLLTLFALLTGLLSACLIAWRLPYMGLFFLLLSGYLDSLDGSVARMNQKTSSFGTILDIVSDRVVEFAVIFAFAYLYKAPYICLLMTGSVLICITSFLVVSMFLTEESEKSFSYSRGLMERAEAFAFFTAMILFPKIFLPLAILFTLLLLLTAILRIRSIYLILKA